LPVGSLGPIEVASYQFRAHGSYQLPETVSFETLIDQSFSKTCHCPGLGKRDSGRWRGTIHEAAPFLYSHPSALGHRPEAGDGQPFLDRKGVSAADG